jgi:hypothetical protein
MYARVAGLRRAWTCSYNIGLKFKNKNKNCFLGF